MSSSTTSTVSICSSSCLAWISACRILRRPCRISGRLHNFSSRWIFPLSIWLISSMSLIRLSRWFPEVWIFFRYSETCSFWSICVMARFVNPTMAFIGVRMSWDIFDKNTLFALLALLAWERAASSSVFCSISLRISASTLRNPRTIPRLPSSAPALTAFIWK